MANTSHSNRRRAPHAWTILFGVVSAYVPGCGGRNGDPESDPGGIGGTQSSANGGAGESSCPAGSERCGCYGNATCDTGLVCGSDICVRLGSGGSPSQAGTVAAGGSNFGGANSNGGCSTGSERCSCYGNLTCDSALVCASGLCVRLPAGGSAGHAGTAPSAGSSGIGGRSAIGGNAGQANGGINQATAGGDWHGGGIAGATYAGGGPTGGTGSSGAGAHFTGGVAGAHFTGGVAGAHFTGGVAGASGPSAGVGNVGGTVVPKLVESNTNWAPAMSPIRLLGNVVVLPGVTLTIAAGTQITAADGVALEVRGTLDVVGTDSAPVVFTSLGTNPTRSSWRGIIVRSLQGASFNLDGAVVEYAYSGLSVECCGAGTGYIRRSTFKHNRVALQGYTGEKIIVDDSVFLDNGCAADSGDKVFNRCTFSGNDAALCSTERVSVYDSTITKNVVGLDGGRGVVQRCVIADNVDVGIISFYEGFDLRDNVIVRNGKGIVVRDSSGTNAPIVGNTICQNLGYDLFLQGSYPVNAANNWWCSTEATLISSRIHDVHADIALGLVTFQPFLTAASPNAPPVP